MKSCVCLISVPHSDQQPLDRAVLGFDAKGEAVVALIGGLPEGMNTFLRNALEVTDRGQSLRPDHLGKMRAIGWSNRAHTIYDGTLEHYGVARVANHHFSLSEVVQSYNTLQRRQHELPRGVVNKIPVCNHIDQFKGQPIVTVTKDYSPRESAPEHPPPRGVAELLGCKSCREAGGCITCHTSGCVSCKWCCIHVDDKDISPTLAAFWQHSSSKKEEMAYWCMGGEAYPVKGGLLVMYHGKHTPHGLWIPEQTLGHRTVIGLALLRRS